MTKTREGGVEGEPRWSRRGAQGAGHPGSVPYCLLPLEALGTRHLRQAGVGIEGGKGRGAAVGRAEILSREGPGE